MRLLYHRLSRIFGPGKVFFLPSYLCSCLFLLSFFQTRAQVFRPDSLPNKQRIQAVSGIIAGGYVCTMLYLGTAWYANETLTRFHFFDDLHEWKQMDKAGHLLGGYQTSRMIIDLYKWAGLPKRKALIAGGLSGFLAMSSIEVFDGFGAGWGFSVYDLGANFIGSSLAVMNEACWNEDRIQLKFSYLPTSYARDPANNRLFGTSFTEWLLKDYNGQVYWLSVNVYSFLPPGKWQRHFPPWLNLTVGYGAQELTGGYGDLQGAWRQREYRQWYAGLDLDLSRMIQNAGFFKSTLGMINFIRLPLPSVEGDRNGRRLLLLR